MRGENVSRRMKSRNVGVGMSKEPERKNAEKRGFLHFGGSDGGTREDGRCWRKILGMMGEGGGAGSKLATARTRGGRSRRRVEEEEEELKEEEVSGAVRTQ
eukprot:741078-Hanusia_phi.AAC.1